MAFTASTVWEVESGGSDTNAGGGFDTGVAGFPTDGAITLATTSAPVIASASYNFVTADTTVGAWVYLKSGTSLIPGWYKIASLSGNSAVLDAAIGHAVLANGTPNTVVGCGTTGTLGTITWGIDYSQATTTRISFTDMLVGATTTQFTSVLNPVGKNFIGNIISVTSGATVQRVAVVSTATTTATCDKSLGTAAQVGVGQMGGALGSPGLASGLAIASNLVFQKSGTYSITSATINISGGCVSLAGSCLWDGYQTVRGDLGAQPLLQASGISTAVLFASAANCVVRSVKVDGASLTSQRGFAINATLGYLLTAINCTNNAFALNSSQPVLIKCAATGCSTQPAFTVGICILCEAYSNTVTGFTTSLQSCWECLAYNNTGASSDGFNDGSNTKISFWNCTSYGNGRDGFRLGGTNSEVINCIAEANTGLGFNLIGSIGTSSFNCAAYNNSGGNKTNTAVKSMDLGFITGSGSFFVNAAGGNFALNNTAGAGALLRAAGIPGVFPSGTTTGFLDIGAAQHADPSSSVAANPLGGFVS